MRSNHAQTHAFEQFEVDTPDLSIACRQYGNARGPCAVLLHGFPYDVHCYDDAAAILADNGYRVLVPFLRGFGPTRFKAGDTMRSGQQAALGIDLLALLDALRIEQCVLGGFDWGGRAACIVGALWPERVKGLVSCGGYNIQHIASADLPADPEHERQYWYQFYFHSERGRAGLSKNRESLCRLLWSLWSPNWAFDTQCFEQSASALHNPDFVDVVVHSYRHRYSLVSGDPRLEPVEQQLADQPKIIVPAICLDGAANGVSPLQEASWIHSQFPALIDHRLIATIGHNIPQESPEIFAQAMMTL